MTQVDVFIGDASFSPCLSLPQILNSSNTLSLNMKVEPEIYKVSQNMGAFSWHQIGYLAHSGM